MRAAQGSHREPHHSGKQRIQRPVTQVHWPTIVVVVAASGAAIVTTERERRLANVSPRRCDALANEQLL
jgi:hypothetical protein